MVKISTAENLVRLGYAVFPVRVAVHDDGTKSVLPLCRWTRESANTVAAVQELNLTWSAATHIGIDCTKSGIVVVDIDPDDDGNLPPLPDHIPRGHVVNSRRGRHHYYRNPDDLYVPNSVGSIAPHIDVRGCGGFVLVYDQPHLVTRSRLPLVPDALVATPKPDRPVCDPANPLYDVEIDDATADGKECLADALLKLAIEWDKDRGKFNTTLNAQAYRVGQAASGGHIDPRRAYTKLLSRLLAYGAGDQVKTLDSGFFAGMSDPVTDIAAHDGVEKHRARFMTEADIDQLPDTQWSVPGFIEAGSINILAAQAGAYKTFLALDMAKSVAHGIAWAGQPTVPGKVLFVALEGINSLKPRLKAWREYHSQPYSDNLTFYRGDLRTKGVEWDSFVEAVREAAFDLVFVDTFSHLIAGSDENSTQEMTEVTSKIIRLRDRTGSAVVLIHHMAKNNPYTRGSSVIRAAIDAEYVAESVNGSMLLTCTKQRNGELPEPQGFELVRMDESALLVPADGGKVAEFLERKKAAEKREKEVQKHDMVVEAVRALQPANFEEVCDHIWEHNDVRITRSAVRDILNDPNNEIERHKQGRKYIYSYVSVQDTEEVDDDE